MPVQANQATRPEELASRNYHPDDDVNRSQYIQEVGNRKHDSCLSLDNYPLPRHRGL